MPRAREADLGAWRRADGVVVREDRGRFGSAKAALFSGQSRTLWACPRQLLNRDAAKRCGVAVVKNYLVVGAAILPSGRGSGRAGRVVQVANGIAYEVPADQLIDPHTRRTRWSRGSDWAGFSRCTRGTTFTPQLAMKGEDGGGGSREPEDGANCGDDDDACSGVHGQKMGRPRQVITIAAFTEDIEVVFERFELVWSTA